MPIGSRYFRALRLALAFAPLAVPALLSGCGDEKPATGTQVDVPPEATSANNAMLESIKAKSQQKKK
jgi:hypothetical protein